MPHEPALPAPFESLFASLEEITFTGPGARFHECFGCGPHHDIGLRVRTFRGEGEVLSPIVIPERFEGPPKGAHGGIVAAYLDEVLAGAARRSYRPRPLDRGVERALRQAHAGRAPAPRPRPRGQAGEKYLDLEGTLEDLETGEVVARATGRFFPMPDGPTSAGEEPEVR